MTTRSLEQFDQLVRADVRPRGIEFLKDAGLVVGATVLMAICAHVSVPLAFSPVPITLQTFGVLLIGFALGSRRALAAMMLYLIEGASGLPVFSPAGPGGVATLLGTTGGFLFAYPAAAYIAGLLARKRNTFVGLISAAILAELVIFAGGALWLLLLTGATPAKVLSLAVLPFIPGEVLKVAAASSLAAVWHHKQRG
ncbi:MAG: BioY protein [Acidobacteriaceae bacterium]|nr:BioY protein [Acidobacteriaceae bacterium]